VIGRYRAKRASFDRKHRFAGKRTYRTIGRGGDREKDILTAGSELLAGPWISRSDRRTAPEFRDLFKASSKAFTAADLLLASPGAREDLQALKTVLSVALITSKQSFAYKA
jgi:hypothetical protein